MYNDFKPTNGGGEEMGIEERISLWSIETMSAVQVTESHGTFEHVRHQIFGDESFLCEHDVHIEGVIDAEEGAIVTLAMIEQIMNCCKRSFPLKFGETLCVIVLASHAESGCVNIAWHCHLTKDLPNA